MRPTSAPHCDCCQGVATHTPARIDNPPGQPQIAYRSGDHAQFLASMQARLSSSAYPALAAFGSREASDFTLAMADALAASLDVLAFYTERFANEHTLRTATERLSVVELARLIGYQAAPGVAASTHLAFTLQDVPGAALGPITIPIGTRVQSVPGQDEAAQTFETVAAVSARAAWNAIMAQQSAPRPPAAGDTRLWLQGSDTGLAAGSVLLIAAIGPESGPDDGARWTARVLTRVTLHPGRGLTEVAWRLPLGADTLFSPPAGESVRVYALRKRAAVFGATAADWRALPDEAKAAYLGLSGVARLERPDDMLEWPDFSVLAPRHPEQGRDRTAGADLRAPAVPDAVLRATDMLIAPSATPALVRKAANPSVTAAGYRRPALERTPDSIDLFPADDALTPGSWALLSVPGQRTLYRIAAASTGNRAEYLLSGQTTRLQLAGPLPNGRLPAAFEHAVRALSVHVGSEELQLAGTPLATPVYGETLALDAHVEGLLPGQAIALGGPAPRIAITHAGRGTPLLADDGSALRTLAEGDSLQLIAPPERLFGNTAEYLSPTAFGAALGDASVRLRLQLADRDGLAGRVEVQGHAVLLAEAQEGDDAQAEIAFIASGDDAISHDRDRSTLRLAKATTRSYDRRRLRINANVAPATHGETVQAIAGGGDASLANQRFILAQAPLTHASAATPGGSASTLEVRVNDVLWQERASLFAAPAEARVFETTRDDRGVTTLQFGDGIEGARLPSGSANVRVRYRKGLGVAGNVAAGTLTTLLSRPLGVTGVANPVAASGGEDAEPLERARENAPVTVLTLERAVSVSDYANFARSFAGIAKAHAAWIPVGPARGVFLSIAGVDGAPVPEDGRTFVNLRDALRAHGDAQLPLSIVNHAGLHFRCRLAVKVLASHDADAVLGVVDAALRRHFAFAARQFGQAVSVDELAAVAQAVPGVEAVDVRRLHRADSAASRIPRLFARLPQATPTAPPAPAEILTLAEEGLELEVLP